MWLMQSWKTGCVGRFPTSRRCVSCREMIPVTFAVRCIRYPPAPSGRGIETHEAKISTLDRKVGQLTTEIDLLEKLPRLRFVRDSESSLIISGPRPVPSGDASLLAALQPITSQLLE